MERKIYQRLKQWKEEGGRTALLIDGARRVGKTHIALEFAKREYKTFLFIDFNRAGSAVKTLFNEGLEDLDTFFATLSALYNVRLYRRESLVVFDEVQLFPRARAAIKYLVEDGRFDYLETGSLMSIKRNVRDIVIPSEEEHVRMFPMDFEEFLWALGNETLMPFIQECFASKRALGFARPMSSAARMHILLAMKRGSSPPLSILAIQYTAAFGSEPLTLLMKAEMMS